MKLNIIFPKRGNDWFNNAVGKLAMPVAPTCLAALTPHDVEISRRGKGPDKIYV